MTTDLLVTGGCGYIGSDLIPRLQGDDRAGEVVVLDSLMSGLPRVLMGAVDDDDITFRRGDVCE